MLGTFSALPPHLYKGHKVS